MDIIFTWFTEEVWGLWVQGGSLMLMLLARTYPILRDPRNIHVFKVQNFIQEHEQKHPDPVD